MTYIIMILGFVLMIKGADFFVDGSTSLAILSKVPPVIIGLTVVAMGTSTPEAAVSIGLVLKQDYPIALANIIGSNIFNLLVIVGICAAIKPFKAESSIMKRDYPISILTTLVFAFFARDGQLSKLEGLILLIGFFSYISYMIYLASKNRNVVSDEILDAAVAKPFSHLKSFTYVLLGVIGVMLGAELVLIAANRVGDIYGLSQNLIGLTFVAIGTSLPELITSVTAALKGNSELALGNIIGSNIFNILFILGISMGVNPIPVPTESIIDILVLISGTLLMYLFLKKDAILTKAKGWTSVGLYVGYFVYIIVR